MSDEYIKRAVASEKVERILNATEEVPDDSDCEVLDKRMDVETEILVETIPENCFEIRQEKDIMKDEVTAEAQVEQAVPNQEQSAEQSTEHTEQEMWDEAEIEGGEQNGAKGDDTEFERY